MTKSKEIIKTIGELLEHYAPWLIGLIVFALAFGAFYGGMKEIKGMDLEQVEGAMIILFTLTLAYWMLGRWAGENIQKIKEDDTADNKTTQDN